MTPTDSLVHDAAPAQTPTPTGPTPPSVHERALVTWLAIFPMVALGLWGLGPVMASWHPVLRALGLTVIVVPLAVYVVVPRLMGLYLKATRRNPKA
ncbi:MULTISPECIES: hypothetical protein [Arthrobacter]|uniref:Uncharacterized protein n=2 Tax=Arthrobacter TaxID=1663 RepID=A0ABU9KG06_9MICC|nr:hypothetical protein [Arthrobacter sp. YJM1]MDP5225743.1 hypothetical protein [Arthrobacter sp. YJM1]